MSSFDKLLDRFLSLDKNLRFFKKKGQSSITIPKHNPIKKVYVIMVKEVIERNDENNE